MRAEYVVVQATMRVDGAEATRSPGFTMVKAQFVHDAQDGSALDSNHSGMQRWSWQ
jgi:hypothetical protein